MRGLSKPSVNTLNYLDWAKLTHLLCLYPELAFYKPDGLIDLGLVNSKIQLKFFCELILENRKLVLDLKAF